MSWPAFSVIFVRALTSTLILLFPFFFLSGEKVVKFSPHEVWYEVYLGEAKVGYAHLSMDLDGERVKSKNEFVMQINRAGQGIEISVEQETLEKANGELIEFSTSTNMAGIPMIKKGWVEGKSLVVFEKQLFSGKRNRYPFDPEAGMSWGLHKQILEQGFMEAGKSFEIKVYSPDLGMNSPVLSQIICHGPKDIMHAGKTIQGYEVDMQMKSSFGSILTKSCFNQKGVGILIEMEMGGMTIRMVQVPERRAKKMEDEAYEVLISSVVPLNQPVPLKSKENVFLMKVEGGKWSGKLFEGPNQIIEKLNANSVRVIVVRDDAIDSVVEQVDENSFLKPNIYLDSSDLLIQKLAKKGKGGATNSREIAKELTSFVNQYIDSKNFSVGFATASEVARTREGDCTEHSILLAALGRALGIPSRVASGVVFAAHFEGKKNVLVYHMWTQFYLGQKWTNYDAAMGYDECPADRIAFSVTSLDESNLVRSMLPVMELINNLQVTLLE